MRLRSKYKTYTQSSASLVKYPQRLFKFRRSKWKKIQIKLLRSQRFLLYSAEKKKRLKKGQSPFFNNFLNKISYKFWQKLRLHYKKGLQIKNNLRKLFDDNISYKYFKKALISQKKSLLLKNIILTNLVKPLFKIDILLWCLNFYTTSYQARQAINNKKVWVNKKTVIGNYYVKKGDVIFLDSSTLLSTVLFKNSLHNFFLTFVEIDYYTKTLVIVKDLNEISSEDLYLVISHYFDLKKFRDYL